MLSMLTDPALSDVCLVVEGIDVPCHKAVLGESVCRSVSIKFVAPLYSSLSSPSVFSLFCTCLVVYVYFRPAFIAVNQTKQDDSVGRRNMYHGIGSVLRLETQVTHT